MWLRREKTISSTIDELLQADLKPRKFTVGATLGQVDGKFWAPSAADSKSKVDEDIEVVGHNPQVSPVVVAGTTNVFLPRSRSHIILISTKHNSRTIITVIGPFGNGWDRDWGSPISLSSFHYPTPLIPTFIFSSNNPNTV